MGALSLSLAVTGSVALKGDRVRNFFDNLLPYNDALRLLVAICFKTEGAESFDLLPAIGRD